MTYGLNVALDDDSLVSLFGESLEHFARVGAPGLCIVDLFPLREFFFSKAIRFLSTPTFLCVSVKYVPSCMPGAGFQKQYETTRTYAQNAVTIPFERLKAERVSTSRLFLILNLSLILSQRAGTALPSLLGSLLDDYETMEAVDPGHEYDIQLIGSIMYAGKGLLTFI